MQEIATISYDTFASIDMRVGHIREALEIEGSDKLYKLTVDFGKDYGVVTVLSGLKPWYTIDQLVGNKYLFVANLQPRSMMGMQSHGMILACDGESKPILTQMSDELAPGARIR